MYLRPVILVNEDLSEGVYAASGSNTIMNTNSDWQITASLNPVEGNKNQYTLVVSGKHATVQGHFGAVRATFTFSEPIISGYGKANTSVSGATLISDTWQGNDPGKEFSYELTVNGPEGLQLVNADMQCRNAWN